MRDVVNVLEAIYRVEQPADAWLQGVLAAVTPEFDQGLGVFGYCVEACRPDEFRAGPLFALGNDTTRVREAFSLWQSTIPPHIQHRIHTFAPSGFAQQIPFGDGEKYRAESNETHRFPDIYGVNGLDGEGRGAVLCAPYPELIYDFTRQDPVIWARIAAHLASAARLLRRHAEPTGDAVFDAGGKLLHADREARDKLKQALLRDGVVSMDRARARHGRRNAREATALWRAMTAGDWTLIDRFERDGRHYVVAMPNRVAAEPAASLTAREAEVFRAAGLGHSNKLIAYELGLSPSTVATHLARVAKKLGVTSRTEIVQLACRASTAKR